MRKRKYLSCIVTMHNGDTFTNPLKLSEAYLISKLAQEHLYVHVTCIETFQDHYTSLFG